MDRLRDPRQLCPDERLDAFCARQVKPQRAIVQVIWEVGKLIVRDSARLGQPALTWSTLGGVVAGAAIMYFTAFLVKF